MRRSAAAASQRGCVRGTDRLAGAALTGRLVAGDPAVGVACPSWQSLRRGRPPLRTLVGARPVPGADRGIDRRGAAPERRPGPECRAMGLHAVLGRGAPQHAGHRQLGAGGPHRPDRVRHIGDPGRLGRGDAPEPCATHRGGAVRHSGGDAPGTDRPGARAGSRHGPGNGAGAAAHRRRAARGGLRRSARGTAGLLRRPARDLPARGAPGHRGLPTRPDPGHPGGGQRAGRLALGLHWL
jgi:hypothetical protein